MSTQVLVKKLNEEVKTLKENVDGMRKILLSSLEDSEGEYKKSFVKKILARSNDPALYEFTTKEAFLRHVRSKK